MNKFKSIDELQPWLADRGIDTSSWGTGDAKSIANLWDELANGDAIFQDKSPFRVTSVVQVIVRRGNYILLEAEQEFRNGRRRFRNQPPAEKMKPGESYTDAARRCLGEELGVDKQDITFVASSYGQKQIIADSASYPGLVTQYTFHTIEAIVKGLPDADFWRDNATHAGSDPIKRHHWAWHLGNEHNEQLSVGCCYPAVSNNARGDNPV